MGKIATVNTSDKVMILGVREAFKRQTNLGTSWTQAKIGFFYTLVPAANDDAAFPTENIVIANYLDYLAMGLKDGSDNAFHQTGSNFMGYCAGHNGALNIYTSTNSAGAGYWGEDQTYSAGHLTTNINGVQASNGGIGNGFTQGLPIFSTSNVNVFCGLRYVVNNFGLSNQTVTIAIQRPATAVTDVSLANLRTLVTNTAYSETLNTATWNSGGAAVPLPDYIYFRIPFLNSRLRITAMAAYKIA